MKKRKQEKAKEKNQYVYCVIKGLIFGLASFLILISLFAFVITRIDLSENQIKICAVLCSALSSFIGGFSSTRSIRRKGVYLGAVTSLSMTVLIFLILLAVNGTDIGYTFFIVMPITLLTGSIGGISAVNIRGKK